MSGEVACNQLRIVTAKVDGRSWTVTTYSSKVLDLIDNAAGGHMKAAQFTKTQTPSRDIATTLELEATLWHCERCSSFIAIHTRSQVVLPICPICVDSTIEFYGPLPQILRLQVADA